MEQSLAMDVVIGTAARAALAASKARRLGGAASIDATPSEPAPAVVANADITLLFFGNSHTNVNSLHPWSVQ